VFIIIAQQRFKAGVQEALNILDDFGFTGLPDRTTLVKFAKRIPLHIWNLALSTPASVEKSMLGAIDATGISRTIASDYYQERIDRINPINKHLKLSLYVDITKRKILSARLRAKPAHDTKDVRYLVNKSNVLSEVNIMDKGYDDNTIHSFFRNKEVFSIIPVRKNARRGRYRKEMRDFFDYGLYFQRSAVEFIISSIKRRYGDYVRCHKIFGQRAEIYSRLILYNLQSLLLFEIFTHAAANMYC
jgi:hypothetical protein